MRIVLFLVCAACIAFIGLCIYESVQEEHACEGRGGKMVGDGNYYTTVSTVNNVTTVYTYEGVKCTK